MHSKEFAYDALVHGHVLHFLAALIHAVLPISFMNVTFELTSILLCEYMEAMQIKWSTNTIMSLWQPYNVQVQLSFILYS